MITKVPEPWRPLQQRPATPRPPASATIAGATGRQISRMSNGPSPTSASHSTPISGPSSAGDKVSKTIVTDQADVQAMLTRDLHRHIKHGDLESVEIVLDCDANPNTCHQQNEPPLFVAVRSNRSKSADIANRLLEHGADANVSSPLDGSTPLIAAIQETQVQKVAYLLRRPDINIHRADRTGISAYAQARRRAAGEDGEAISRMMERHYQIHRNEDDDEWFTAAHQGNLPLLKELYTKHGVCMVDHVGRSSYTALWTAAGNHRLDAVAKLLAWGADVDFHNGDGVTVMDNARNHFADDVVTVLEEHRATRTVKR